MSDLINRKEAVEAIKNEMLSWLEGDSHDYRKVVDAIMDLPTVDAEPVRHGYWKYGEDRFGYPNWECSVCGCHGRGDYNYCPWCGAKMYEEMEE